MTTNFQPVYISISVSNTGFPVFGTLIPIPAVLAVGGITVLRTYKMGAFDQNDYLLKKMGQN
jgi:hypothetical protein